MDTICAFLIRPGERKLKDVKNKGAECFQKGNDSLSAISEGETYLGRLEKESEKERRK